MLVDNSNFQILIMQRILTTEERIKAVKYYYQTDNASESARRIAEEFMRPAPKRQTVVDIVKRFEEHGSVKDLPRSGRPSLTKNEEFQARLQEALVPNESTSTRRLAREITADGDNGFRVSHMTVKRTLKKMNLHPFRPVLLQALHEDDNDRRLEFCEQFLEMQVNQPNLFERVLWSDEATFKLNGHINRHNCIYYEAENPHVILEKEVNMPGLSVWAGVWYGGIIGPYFFNGTINGLRYQQMLAEFVWPAVSNFILEDEPFYYQHDGAAPHFARVVRDWMNEHFQNQWIGRRGYIDWPPRSPDLTVPDFFLWGYLKDRVYGRNPVNLAELRTAITEEVEAISIDMIRKVCRSVPHRFQVCINNNGNHFEHLM